MASDCVMRHPFVGSLTVSGSIGLAGCGGLKGNGNWNSGNGNGDDGSPTEGTDDGESSPTEEETEEPVDETDLLIRAVHSVVGAPDMDVYIDDEPTFERLSYADITSYAPIDSGSAQVRVTPAGGDQVLFENEFDVEDEGSYSVVAFGEFGAGMSGGESTPTEDM